ncbi:hypothetical protein L2750_14425 [Shewanella submarina]|uniref:Uncharacterized protein n=1 Tax=Shewanella submarina TaxID=2016376 RepID=A0ABV7G5N4_9GAMM|nr:hypothetical protein [Shewanella submarina]MCL1038326.1 hypothetical protein [Shewanella submarina]
MSFTVFSVVMLAYGLAAVSFELVKPVLFHASVSAARTGDSFKAIAFGFVALCISSVSVFASVTAIQSGVNTAKTQSAQYQQVNSQIERLVSLSDKQSRAGQITRASETEKRITELMASLPAAAPESPMTKHSFEISMIVSVLCELIVACCASFAPHARVKEAKAGLHIENMTNNIQVNANLDLVRDSIIKGDTKPSFRGIAENFKGIRREDVRALLSEMAANGLLVEYRNGYRLIGNQRGIAV